jgi:membrane protein
MKRTLTRLDAFQQRTPWLAFPLAVVKKFGDDQAGNLAALLAWSALAAIFPLLLVLVTVLGIVLRHDLSLRTHILNSAFVQFPVIGQQIRDNVNSLNRVGVGLLVGLVGTFLGARGVANAAQNALNSVWEVPIDRRPKFPWSLLRSIALVLVMGIGIIVTTTLSGLGGGNGGIGIGLRVGALVGAFALNVLLFSLSFRLASAPEVQWRDLWLGAFLTATVWQILQLVGGFVVAHNLKHMSNVYGTFALVLGLMSWLYLQAQLTLYAIEVDVVRCRRLWPRTFFGTRTTQVDQRALTTYGKVEERTPEERVDVNFEPPQGPREPSSPLPPERARD